MGDRERHFQIVGHGCSSVSIAVAGHVRSLREA